MVLIWGHNSPPDSNEWALFQNTLVQSTILSRFGSCQYRHFHLATLLTKDANKSIKIFARLHYIRRGRGQEKLHGDVEGFYLSKIIPCEKVQSQPILFSLEYFIHLGFSCRIASAFCILLSKYVPLEVKVGCKK